MFLFWFPYLIFCFPECCIYASIKYAISGSDHWFGNDFNSWLSHSSKLLANRLTRDPNIVIHGNSCIILYLLDCAIMALDCAELCLHPTIICLDGVPCHSYDMIFDPHSDLSWKSQEDHCQQVDQFHLCLLDCHKKAINLITWGNVNPWLSNIFHFISSQQ